MENQNLNQQPVEQPIPQVPIQPEQPVISPQQSKTHWPILILVLVLAVVSYTGVAYWQNMWPFVEDEVTEASPSITPKSTSNVPADWKTYINDELGFEFKYPVDWSVIESLVTGSELVYMTLGPSYSIQSGGHGIFYVETKDENNLPLHGWNTTEVSSNYKRFELFGDNIVYKLEHDRMFDDIFDQIISTFQFTKSNSKTYQNSTFQYSIKYPSDLNLYENNEDFQSAQGSYIGGATHYLGEQGFVSLIIAIPNGEYPGTTYAGAFISVAINDEIGTADECYKSSEPITAESYGIIGGVQAYKGQRGGAGGGHSRGTTFYHMFANNMCYEVALTFDSTGGGIERPIADISAILNKLEGILKSITFLGS